MALYNVYRGTNFRSTYLVLRQDEHPQNAVPFNLLFLFGKLEISRKGIRPTHLPFAKGGQEKIVECIEEKGFCFYKWPGKILGVSLGDVLDPTA
jgi:hypothetical protein